MKYSTHETKVNVNMCIYNYIYTYGTSIWDLFWNFHLRQVNLDAKKYSKIKLFKAFFKKCEFTKEKL